MATRPTTSALWATDNVNNTAPNLAKRQLGWQNSEDPASSFFNWWQNLVGQWCDFLADSIVDFGTATLRSDQLTIDGTATFNAGASAAAGQSFVVSAAGRFKHGDYELVIPASAFMIYEQNVATPSSVPSLLGGQWSFTAPPGDSITAPIVLPVGTRIRTIRWYFNKGGSASPLTMALRKRVGNGAVTTVSSTSDVSSGASEINVVTGAIDYTMETLNQVYLTVLAGSTSHKFSQAVVTYDNP